MPTDYGDGGPTYGELFGGATFGTFGMNPAPVAGARLRIRPRYVDLPATGFPAPSTDTGLWIRAAPAGTRTGSIALHGATLTSSPVSIFLGAGGDPAVSVAWTIDGADVSTDEAAPFDLEGADGAGIPAPLRALSDGSHTIGAKIIRPDASKVHVEATFTAVAMSGGGGTGGSPSTVKAALGVFMESGVRVSKVEQQLARPLRYKVRFASWRGATWSQLVQYITDDLANTTWRTGTFTQILTTSPIPDPAKVAGVSLAAAARGDYDAYYRQIRDVLLALPAGLLSRLMLRWAWEFNGKWYPFTIVPDGTTQAERELLADNLAATWRRFHGIVMHPTTGVLSRPDGASLLWDWNPTGPAVNRTTERLLTERAFPGAAYVDTCSIDYYTNYSNLTNTDLRAALAWLTNFAVANSTPTKRLLTGLDETSTGAILNIPTGMTWKSSWASTTAYTTGQIVVQDDVIYRAVAASTSVTPGTDATKWTKAYVHRGNWSSVTAYVPSDVVRSGTQEWVANTAHTNVTPSTIAPGSTAWKPLVANGGLGDYPELFTELDNWMRAEATANRLHHVCIFEEDVAGERTMYAVIARQWIYPGRDDWKVGKVPIVTTAGSNQVALAGDGGGGWDESDVSYSITATGIPTGAAITAVNAAHTIATMNVNATATNSTTATLGGIPDPSDGCNYPRAARRAIRLWGGPA